MSTHGDRYLALFTQNDILKMTDAVEKPMPHWRVRFLQRNTPPTVERVMACVQQNDLALLTVILAKAPTLINASFGTTGWTPFLAACQNGWRDGVVAMFPHANLSRPVPGLPKGAPLVLLARHGFPLLNDVLSGATLPKATDFGLARAVAASSSSRLVDLTLSRNPETTFMRPCLMTTIAGFWPFGKRVDRFLAPYQGRAGSALG